MQVQTLSRWLNLCLAAYAQGSEVAELLELLLLCLHIQVRLMAPVGISYCSKYLLKTLQLSIMASICIARMQPSLEQAAVTSQDSTQLQTTTLCCTHNIYYITSTNFCQTDGRMPLPAKFTQSFTSSRMRPRTTATP